MTGSPSITRAPPGVLFTHAGAELYGADRILIELTAGLKQRGFAQWVVLPTPGPLHAELAARGIPTLRCNLGVLRRKYFTPLGLLNRACRVMGAVRFMRRLIRENAIAVVHSNTTAVFAGAIAARLEGLPHVWHVHEITTRPRWFARGIAYCVGRWSDRAVFVSEATRRHMCSLDARVEGKSVVIYNGIDTARACAGTRGVLRSECGWPADAPVVGMIGRINWWKGQSTLLACAVRLAPTHPSARFLMVGGIFGGETRSRDDLIGSIEKHRLTSRVAVQDFRDDIGNVLADIDVFVLPSTEPDPFPTVVLEAMAAGRPVVAFRHGGVCEMVEDGVTGLLCVPGDVEAMSEAIARLVADPALRQDFGRAAQDRLQRLFTREAFIARFSALYHELTA